MLFYNKGDIVIEVNDDLKDKFINVHMNDIQISTNEKPIIGTFGLGPCMAFILHSKENKKTIVGHVPCSQLMNNNSLEKLRLQILKIIIENKLIDSSFDLILVEGAQKSGYYKDWYELEILQNQQKKPYSLFEVLEKNLTQIDLVRINSIQNSNFSAEEIQTVNIKGDLCIESNNEASKQFAFNANNGNFITNELFILRKQEETKKY